jgi:predicted RNase H-like nuclease (RuvC/YqgF family)
MRELRRFLLFFSASALLFSLAAYAQDDSPSLGDVARQARLDKQQKDTQAKDSQSKDTTAKDTPSKDVATKDAPAKDAQVIGKDTDGTAKDVQAPESHVITNENLSERIGPIHASAPGSGNTAVSRGQPTNHEDKASAEQWKSQIEALQNNIASLKSNIDNLTASIQYAPGNCVSGCVQWNEHQKQKQDQVDAMKAQLEQAEQRLEEIQEAARKEGYGSSVYDP